MLVDWNLQLIEPCNYFLFQLALLSYRIRTDEDWVKVAKALKNEREPEEYKKVKKFIYSELRKYYI